MLLRRTLGRLACLLGLFLFIAAANAAVHYDMTREELLKELGKPSSTLKNPNTGREVLNYPKGVRIELDQGVVVSVKGLDLAAVEEATKAAAAEKAEAEEQARIEREVAEKAAAEAAAKAAPKETAPAPEAAAPAGNGQYTMLQAVAALEKREARAEHQNRRAYADEDETFNLGKFLLGQIVWFGLMIVALKLTSMLRDMDIEWSGLVIAAAADTGTRTLLALVAWFVFHTTTFFFLNQLIASGVMMLVLKKVSLNQTWPKAARVAFGVKGVMLVLRYVLAKALNFTV